MAARAEKEEERNASTAAINFKDHHIHSDSWVR